VGEAVLFCACGPARDFAGVVDTNQFISRLTFGGIKKREEHYVRPKSHFLIKCPPIYELISNSDAWSPNQWYPVTTEEEQQLSDTIL
jgi:hypothetical protein